MKLIVLAKLHKRVLGKLFDFLLVTILSCLVFFFGAYPATFDKDSYVKNQDLIVQKYDDSELFLKSSIGTINSKAGYAAIDSIEKLTSITLHIDDEDFKNVNITESLVKFYTTHLVEFGYENNLSFDVFKTSVLKINSEISNIKDLKYINGKFHYELMDETKAFNSVVFVTDTYSEAVKIVENSKYIRELNDQNIQIMRKSLVLFIPIFIGLSFIFDLFIPLVLKKGQSLGKLICGTCLLTKDGYNVKFYQVIIRWLSYLIYGVALGMFTFFGTVLISYTMLMFNKKRRTVSDYISGTIVIDKKNSIWFKTREEENRYNERVAYKNI